MHSFRLLWILIVCVLTGGCNSTAFLYDNAPWFVREKIDEYFSVSNTQEQQLDRDIGAFFKWHRHIELPKYAHLLSTFQAQFNDGLTRDELVFTFDKLTKARIRFGEAGLPSASRFLATASDQQLANFSREFHQELDEDRELLELSPEQRNEKIFNRLLDAVEGWTGNFSERQRQKLQVLSEAQPDHGHWLAHREQRHQELIVFLHGKPDETDIQAYLRKQYVLRQLAGEQMEFEERIQVYWLSTILEIDAMLTQPQRSQAMKRLEGYRLDFIRLSQRNDDIRRLPVEKK